MKENKVNITIEKGDKRINFTTTIKKGMLEDFVADGFKIITVQY